MSILHVHITCPYSISIFNYYFGVNSSYIVRVNINSGLFIEHHTQWNTNNYLSYYN